MDSVSASKLYSSICNCLGITSVTQCQDYKVLWVSGDYNFIIFGINKNEVDATKKQAKSVLLGCRKELRND